MASSSQVESIFFAALEKKAGAERAACLDQACGADAALRFQVERLLEAHPHSKVFLAQPAVNREKIDARHSTEKMNCGPDSSPSDPTAGSELLSTLGNERGEDVENALIFLEPWDRPGSLGRLALRLLSGLPSGSVEQWFETARCHAALAGLPGQAGSGVSPSQSKTEADHAMASLRKAVNAGYRNSADFRTDSALDPLRKREDFKRPVKELEKLPPAKPEKKS